MNDVAEQPSHEEQIDALKRQWAELPPRQWQLLRMSPLATDRGTGARPLRFAELARLERHSPSLSLLRLTIQLPAQMLHKEQNVLEVWLDHQQRTLAFGPQSGLQIEPSNRGLGRFLLAQCILWAQQRCGHYQVIGAELAAKDSFDEQQRNRRNYFLESLGFTVTYSDQLQIKGSFGANLVSDLLGEWNRDKVQTVALLDAGKMLQQADQTLAEQALKLRQKEEQLTANKRDESALRFSINALLMLCLFLTGLTLWMMFR